MVSTLKVTKIQIPNSDSDVISLDASTGNITFNKTISGSGYDLLASVYSTDTQSSVEISLPTGYTSYYLTIYSETDTSSSGHYDLTYKRDGQSSFDTSDYSTQGALMDVTGNHLNTNSGGSSLQLVATNSGLNGAYYFNIWLNGYGTADVASSMTYTVTKAVSGAGSATWVGGGANTVDATNNSKMIAVNFAPSTGNITKLHYRLFGIA